MTHFKVSDEVLKASLSSIVLEGEDVLHSIVFGLNNDDETIRRLMAEEIVRAAIEAALPVMFEPIYQFRYRDSSEWAELYESVYLTLSEDNDEDTMEFRVIYCLKESK